jgi:hypothetical protein
MKTHAEPPACDQQEVRGRHRLSAREHFCHQVPFRAVRRDPAMRARLLPKGVADDFSRAATTSQRTASRPDRRQSLEKLMYYASRLGIEVRTSFERRARNLEDELRMAEGDNA